MSPRSRAPWDGPGKGRYRGAAAQLRHFPVGSYLILYYREISGGIEAVRIIHGARLLTDVFE